MGGVISGLVATAFWAMAMSFRNEMEMGTLEPTWLTPTARETLVRLNRAVANAVSAPDLYNRFLERGIELKASSSPEEFTAHIKAEFEKKGRLAREAGIKPE